MNDKEVNLTEESYSAIATVLDSLDALVYVSDMQTYELLFVNEYGRSIWGDIQGKICWKALQIGQTGPCPFCTNNILLDDCGAPTKAYVWEFQNTVNKRWYQCRDKSVPWINGHMVRLEIATDITEKKHAEEELELAKERAEELARKDDLTGLRNRRAFFEQGKLILEMARRYCHSVSVIMMDIDHFKMINDKYGHSIGDKVLQAVAVPLEKMVREIDIVARIGGEEFALVLPETSLEHAANLAERLRSEVEILSVTGEGHQIKFTASFGVVNCKDGAKNIEALLTDADDALYVAKKNGRNIVKISA